MADPNDVMSLFEETPDAQGTAAEVFPETSPPAPEPPPAPVTPVGPDPYVQALQQQVSQLSTLMGQMFQQGFQKPQEPQKDPWEPLKVPQTYFDEREATALLNGPKPIEELNRLGNKIRESVATPLMGVIQQQQAQLQEYFKQQQMQEYRRTQAEEARRANEDFFQSYPDLRPAEKLVRMEAALLAEEAQRNPHLLAGKSNRDAAVILADRVRQTLTGMGVPQQATTPAAPARTPHLERGGASRLPNKPKGDANTSNLREMSQFIKQGRTR